MVIVFCKKKSVWIKEKNIATKHGLNKTDNRRQCNLITYRLRYQLPKFRTWTQYSSDGHCQRNSACRRYYVTWDPDVPRYCLGFKVEFVVKFHVQVSCVYVFLPPFLNHRMTKDFQWFILVVGIINRYMSPIVPWLKSYCSDVSAFEV